MTTNKVQKKSELTSHFKQALIVAILGLLACSAIYLRIAREIERNKLQATLLVKQTESEMKDEFFYSELKQQMDNNDYLEFRIKHLESAVRQCRRDMCKLTDAICPEEEKDEEN